MSSKLEKRFIEFIRARERVKKLLLAKADDLENYLKKAKIAKLTGAPLSIIGTGLGAVGFVSGFFTLGAGFGLCIAGAAVAGTGGVLGAGGTITEVVAAKKILSGAQKLLDEDKLAAKRLEKELNDMLSIKMIGSVVGEVTGVIVGGVSVIALSLKYASIAANVADDVAVTAFRSLSYAGRAFQTIGFGVSIVFLPSDIITFVTNTKSLYNNEIPEKVKYLREVAAQITVPDEQEFIKKFRNLREQ